MRDYNDFREYVKFIFNDIDLNIFKPQYTENGQIKENADIANIFGEIFKQQNLYWLVKSCGAESIELLILSYDVNIDRVSVTINFVHRAMKIAFWVGEYAREHEARKGHETIEFAKVWLNVEALNPLCDILIKAIEVANFKK